MRTPQPVEIRTMTVYAPPASTSGVPLLPFK